jgi:hypothetical protein
MSQPRNESKCNSVSICIRMNFEVVKLTAIEKRMNFIVQVSLVISDTYVPYFEVNSQIKFISDKKPGIVDQFCRMHNEKYDKVK